MSLPFSIHITLKNGNETLEEKEIASYEELSIGKYRLNHYHMKAIQKGEKGQTNKIITKATNGGLEKWFD